MLSHAKKEMVFSSLTFLWVFLPVVYAVNLLLPKRFSNCFLLLASLLFYAWGEPYLVLLMMATILVNWIAGLAIGLLQGRGRKIVLTLGVLCDLGALGYFKYAGLLTRLLNTAAGKELIPVPQIALPIGISFFTFQAISYIVDVYRRETVASPSLINTALYISFFPQLIAGPIVKYRDISRQIVSRKVTAKKTAQGFRRFAYGLAKKVLIANVMGRCADAVFNASLSQIGPATAWVGALAYAMQIYYDFSGYSDMAIGLGRMFGFKFQKNFDYPYLSASVTEFWRRWHISLGSWFREYVYIPLGGNRKGPMRTYINLLIVFFLTGLWHGADLSFVLWGLYHGLFLILERLGFKKILDRCRPLAAVGCFLAVTFGWVLFRASDTPFALQYTARMLAPWRYTGMDLPLWNYLNVKTLWCGAAAVLGMGFIQRFTPPRLTERWKHSVPEAVFCAVLTVLSLASIAANMYNPFIYFQF